MELSRSVGEDMFWEKQTTYCHLGSSPLHALFLKPRILWVKTTPQTPRDRMLKRRRNLNRTVPGENAPPLCWTPVARTWWATTSPVRPWPPRRRAGVWAGPPRRAPRLATRGRALPPLLLRGLPPPRWPSGTRSKGWSRPRPRRPRTGAGLTPSPPVNDASEGTRLFLTIFSSRKRKHKVAAAAAQIHSAAHILRLRRRVPAARAARAKRWLVPCVRVKCWSLRSTST